MSAEFDTMAEWTARVAVDLGEDFYLPAACRGSGSPAALDWLMDGLDLVAGQLLLDCGAGIGGPAAYAAQRKSIHPILVDPERGACRAARELFGYPVIQGGAAALPIADAAADVAWALGVLCTMEQQVDLLTEMRRVLRPAGRIGLLVFVAQKPVLGEQPTGNHFPTVTSLTGMVNQAGLHIDAWRGTAEMAAIPDDWQRRADTVTTELTTRYGHVREFQLAEHQSDLVATMLADEAVSGELLVLSRSDAEERD